jgi:hypothetical protein
MTLVACCALAGSACADFLPQHQWEHRLLFVPEMNPKIERELTRDPAGLEERDIRIFVLKGPSKTGSVPTPEQASEIHERIGGGDKPEIVLLGKDGRTTVRWSVDEFTLASLYARIDAMPMRQREMKELR